jgi:hypothetical protein
MHLSRVATNTVLPVADTVLLLGSGTTISLPVPVTRTHSATTFF